MWSKMPSSLQIFQSIANGHVNILMFGPRSWTVRRWRRLSSANSRSTSDSLALSKPHLGAGVLRRTYTKRAVRRKVLSSIASVSRYWASGMHDWDEFRPVRPRRQTLARDDHLHREPHLVRWRCTVTGMPPVVHDGRLSATSPACVVSPKLSGSMSPMCFPQSLLGMTLCAQPFSRSSLIPFADVEPHKSKIPNQSTKSRRILRHAGSGRSSRSPAK